MICKFHCQVYTELLIKPAYFLRASIYSGHRLYKPVRLVEEIYADLLR
jgi:hypothetical protein